MDHTPWPLTVLKQLRVLSNCELIKGKLYVDVPLCVNRKLEHFLANIWKVKYALGYV